MVDDNNTSFMLFVFWTQFVLWTAVPVASFVWKRQMIKGGSAIAKLVKTQALKRKQRKRRRLGDILKDDLVRNQMIRQFQRKMTTQECEQRIQELKEIAAQEVTSDDVHISIDNILEAAMMRIWLAFGAWLLLLFFGWDSMFYAHIGICLAWIGIHELDNRVNFGKFELMSCCGTKPAFDDDDDEALIQV
jgi:ABC-type multidrug transport system fused ATPase/permease subunit